MSNAFTQLKQKALDNRIRQRPRVSPLAMRINILLQISIEILENKVKTGLFLGLILGIAIGGGIRVAYVLHGEKSNDVERMREHLE